MISLIGLPAVLGLLCSCTSTDQTTGSDQLPSQPATSSSASTPAVSAESERQSQYQTPGQPARAAARSSGTSRSPFEDRRARPLYIRMLLLGHGRTPVTTVNAVGCACATSPRTGCTARPGRPRFTAMTEVIMRSIWQIMPSGSTVRLHVGRTPRCRRLVTHPQPPRLSQCAAAPVSARRGIRCARWLPASVPTRALRHACARRLARK